ncbi:MAG: phosphoribosylaminoimidazolesuccinocarboxamide synthase [candidate division KSB1 bacterium]|nr:phosphoribosylaminoimidazolesuccinocarboxamide synthase [candidate division KSB1 bacterium]
MGSVKDLHILTPPTAEHPGKGRFVFSDRYSVFDWGEMPDHIARKGEALCLIGAYFFEKAERLGIATHYRGLVQDGCTVRLSQLGSPVNTMEVSLLQVIRPTVRGDRYDYSAYTPDLRNFLLPLEVIFRNALPAGSSVFKRLQQGKLTLEELGLCSMPEPGHKLERPILDVSTKLETTDRYLTWEEAQRTAGLSKQELEALMATTMRLNELITAEVGRMGLVHEDGKVEFGFDEERHLMVVDVIGTPDECRFTMDGVPVSKEVARIFYRSTPWFQEVDKAKKHDPIGWKSAVQTPPPPLPPPLAQLIAFMYQGFCNELTGRRWFDCPPLAHTVSEVRRTVSSFR